LQVASYVLRVAGYGQQGHRAKGIAHGMKRKQVVSQRIQVSEIKKSQITKHKYQTNYND
jgi:hypothetical protein